MDDPSTTSVTEGFGLMFYNARWYDPSLGRFAQADTMIPQSQGVQAWDRYAYGLNNPSRYTDPSGHVPVDCYGTTYCGASNSDLFSDGTRATYGRGLIGPALPPNYRPPTYGDGLIGPPLPPDYETPNPPTYGNGLIGPPLPPGVNVGQTWINDFVYPWEINRLSGIGYRFNASYWHYVIRVDFSLDVLYNFNSGELSVLPTIAPVNLGIGGGGDVAPIGVVAVYDAPNNDALTGGSGSASANVAVITGLQVSYSSSASPGSTGQYAQAYYVGIPFGAEFSLGAGYGYTPYNWQIINP